MLVQEGSCNNSCIEKQQGELSDSFIRKISTSAWNLLRIIQSYRRIAMHR